MILVDSHAHLDSPDFQHDCREVLNRAAQAGVRAILTIGCIRQEVESISVFRDLLENHEQVYGAAGVHPHDARYYTEELGDWVQQLMEHPKVIAWGEIGLDFQYDHSPHADQVEAFRSQLRRARASEKPVIIHSRQAEEMTCQILEEEFSAGPGGVLHCFTYGLETANRCQPLGFYCAFGGILTFPKAEKLRQTAARIPAERLLVETDSPYLAPVPFRGKRNEPAYVVKVAEILAQIRQTSLEEVASLTTANFMRLFGPPGAHGRAPLQARFERG